MPQGTHAVGWGCRENGERVRAYCTHTLHAGCYTTCFPCRTLNPQQPPHPLSPWERVRERVTSRKACIGAVRVLRKVAEIRGVPSPQPSPTGGRGKVAADSDVAGRLKKNARSINSRNFLGSLYHKADGTNAAIVFFRRPLNNPSAGCVPQGTHAVG